MSTRREKALILITWSVEKCKNRPPKSIPILVTGLFVVAAVLYLSFTDQPGITKGLTVFLLFIPFAQILIFSAHVPAENNFVLRGIYLWVMSTSLFAYTVLWSLWMYTKPDFFGLVWPLQGLAFISVLLAAALLIIAVAITVILLADFSHPSIGLNDDRKTILNATREEMQTHRCSLIFFFLTVFLCISYHFSFALAFHDRYQMLVYKSPGLFSSEVLNPWRKADKSGDDAAVGDQDQAGNPSSEFRQQSTDEGAGNSPPQGAEASPVSMIYFPESSAAFKIDSEPQTLPQRQPHYGEDFLRVALNTAAIDQVLSRIRALREEDEYQRIEVKYVGHSSDRPIREGRGRYTSNFELSFARTQNVRDIVEQEIGGETGEWYNIYPLQLPQSNERNFLISEEQLDRRLSQFAAGDGPDPTLSVEVSVRPIPEDPARKTTREESFKKLPREILDALTLPKARPLLLLDYIYFTIYTITTTGYGDIIPLSSEAKCISTLANIFELFFIVIFFNVLLSTATHRRVVQESGDASGVTKGKGKVRTNHDGRDQKVWADAIIQEIRAANQEMREMIRKSAIHANQELMTSQAELGRGIEGQIQEVQERVVRVEAVAREVGEAIRETSTGVGQQPLRVQTELRRGIEGQIQEVKAYVGRVEVVANEVRATQGDLEEMISELQTQTEETGKEIVTFKDRILSTTDDLAVGFAETGERVRERAQEVIDLMTRFSKSIESAVGELRSLVGKSSRSGIRRLIKENTEAVKILSEMTSSLENKIDGR